jgi:hypothetical protein
MIRLRQTAHDISPTVALPIQPIPLLDERVVALLREGRLRTAALVAAVLGTASAAVESSLLRLAGSRRVLRAGYVVPEERGYGIPWPALWGLAKQRP